MLITSTGDRLVVPLLRLIRQNGGVLYNTLFNWTGQHKSDSIHSIFNFVRVAIAPYSGNWRVRKRDKSSFNVQEVRACIDCLPDISLSIEMNYQSNPWNCRSKLCVKIQRRLLLLIPWSQIYHRHDVVLISWRYASLPIYNIKEWSRYFFLFGLYSSIITELIFEMVFYWAWKQCCSATIVF